MTLELSADDRARIAELGMRYRLWSPAEEPTLVSRGGENTTFAVGEYIVRCSGDLDAVNREVELLDALAGATSVPTPTPELHEPESGTFAYRRLRGAPLIHRRHRDTKKIRHALIDVLSALRESPRASRLPVDPYPNEQWHADAAETYTAVLNHLDGEQARIVRAFLSEPPPPTRTSTVAQHNDLGAEHILVDDAGEVTGIIDWTDAAMTDPARDIGSLYRDLGPAAALRVGESLDGPITEDELRRIRFHARCKWLEDVAFGIEDPWTRKPYLDNATITFDHTFAADP
ncbi:phosphotransferase family protein [Microbacterium sp.]|jgi:aminoglycoside phosphotransferase (APT) family kinase protein|uniref:phosphotransferase family protein n=1 Tax=Microbacterium sp. TaxID=51671 RepID=UPI002C6E66A6|nr:phosphotransferase [Microbacterium sp.]HET6301113.1 phosphotransferase [Microbacterium sp.]HWL77633.1 phosphotransferase [Microbacterium sp.]